MRARPRLPFLMQPVFLRSVAALSNLPFFRSRKPAEPLIRPARENELEPAARLVLAMPGQFASRAQVTDFLDVVRGRMGGIGAWVAEARGRLTSAILPMVSPGRTMLLFTPGMPGDAMQMQATRQMTEEICRRGLAEGVQLAQVLVEPDQAAIRDLFADCGFASLAELIYLQVEVPRGIAPPSLAAGQSWINYSPQTHALFAATILSTYQHSLDCPGLNGLRDIEDVIAGHKASGEFTPGLWFLLREHERPLGVLLLAPIPRADVMELAYLGLAPEARGRGIGELMMRQAAAMVSASPQSRLSLAVDARNEPALRLYWRHGMRSIGRKLAMIRRLNSES